jgi:hypothetical protein
MINKKVIIRFLESQAADFALEQQVFKICSDRDIGPKFKEIEVSIS